MTADDDDIVRSLFGMVREAVAAGTGLSATDWRRLEVQARLEWGGSRPYVPKRADDVSWFALETRRSVGVPMAEACRTEGVSLRHGYRLRRELK